MHANRFVLKGTFYIGGRIFLMTSGLSYCSINLLLRPLFVFNSNPLSNFRIICNLHLWVCFKECSTCSFMLKGFFLMSFDLGASL